MEAFGRFHSVRERALTFGARFGFEFQTHQLPVLEPQEK